MDRTDARARRERGHRAYDGANGRAARRDVHAFEHGRRDGRRRRRRGEIRSVASTTIELASLVLGSESFAERVYDADAVDGEAFPPAFAGYRRVRVGVRLVEAPAEDAAGDDDARPATSTPSPFLPAGLARDLRPFAVTLHRASNLPDAPASHAALDELCEPIGAHLAWRHPKTKESVWPKTDDDDDKDNAAARVVSWRTASSTTPWRTVVPLESFSAPFMTRDARFDSSLMFMAKDMPTDLHDACASAPLELRIHDRVVRAVPEKFPGLDKLEGKDDGSGEGAEGARVPKEAGRTRRVRSTPTGSPSPPRTPKPSST